MKTHVVKAGEIERNWVLIDAEGQVLGRLASHVANVLRGKDKPNYTPHLDVGDHVVVTNAAKIKLTGRKLTQKRYYSHSGYPGGLKVRTLQELMEKNPEEVVYRAVKGMLPHTKLGRQQLRKLRVYAGAEHKQQAQSPQPEEA
ncbi:MAG: 50S ribosomal protein L13 [Candidatus Latescibacterota bacterium]|nr:MAG: 50S ribosomal protein L13 [Candidatus Latescibacterota bacterium]